MLVDAAADQAPVQAARQSPRQPVLVEARERRSTRHEAAGGPPAAPAAHRAAGGASSSPRSSSSSCVVADRARTVGDRRGELVLAGLWLRLFAASGSCATQATSQGPQHRLLGSPAIPASLCHLFSHVHVYFPHEAREPRLRTPAARSRGEIPRPRRTSSRSRSAASSSSDPLPSDAGRDRRTASRRRARSAGS